MSTIKLFHGSDTIIPKPDLTFGRDNVDFGRGFYLSADYTASAKWACRRTNAVCNQYELELYGLRIYEFTLDKTWLDFVVCHRETETPTGQLAEIARYDVLIGAIADDRLYQTLEMYVDGFVTADKAVEIMNCMDYGTQIVLKTEKAVNQLKFLGYTNITGPEKDQFKIQFREDTREASRRTTELLREMQ